MTARIALFLFIVVSGLVVAHFFRFVPMPGGEPFGFYTIWDRWLQRVCVISFVDDNRVSCSREAFQRQSSTPNEAKPRPMSKIEEMRQAGFSDLELLEYVEEQIKIKRREGMSDVDLAADIFGPRQKAKR